MIEIAQFISAVSHVTNIAKTLLQERDEAKRNAAYSELIGALADTKAQYLAVVESKQSLLDANEALKKQVSEYDKWEQESARYVLKKVDLRSFVYALHPDKKSGQPPHWLCPNCYKDRKKSVLQCDAQKPLSGVFKCHSCGAEIFSNRAP